MRQQTLARHTEPPAHWVGPVPLQLPPTGSRQLPPSQASPEQQSASLPQACVTAAQQAFTVALLRAQCVEQQSASAAQLASCSALQQRLPTHRFVWSGQHSPSRVQVVGDPAARHAPQVWAVVEGPRHAFAGPPQQSEVDGVVELQPPPTPVQHVPCEATLPPGQEPLAQSVPAMQGWPSAAGGDERHRPPLQASPAERHRFPGAQRSPNAGARQVLAASSQMRPLQHCASEVHPCDVTEQAAQCEAWQLDPGQQLPFVVQLAGLVQEGTMQRPDEQLRPVQQSAFVVQRTAASLQAHFASGPQNWLQHCEEYEFAYAQTSPSARHPATHAASAHRLGPVGRQQSLLVRQTPPGCGLHAQTPPAQP